MCTGFELLMGALGLGGAVAPLLGPKAPDPPPLPATATPGTRAPGATVRVGTGQDEGTNTDSNTPNAPKFVAKRSSGQAFNNLGKSGLAL